MLFNDNCCKCSNYRGDIMIQNLNNDFYNYNKINETVQSSVRKNNFYKMKLYSENKVNKIFNPIESFNKLSDIFSFRHDAELFDSDSKVLKNKSKIISDMGYVLEVDKDGKIIRVIEEPEYVKKIRDINKEKNNKNNKKEEKTYKVKGKYCNVKSSVKISNGGNTRIKISDVTKIDYEITKNQDHKIKKIDEVVKQFTDLIVYHNKKLKKDKNFKYKVSNHMKKNKFQFKKVGLVFHDNNNIIFNKSILKESMLNDFNKVKEIMNAKDGVLEYFRKAVDSCWDISSASYNLTGGYSNAMDIGSIMDSIN